MLINRSKVRLLFLGHPLSQCGAFPAGGKGWGAASEVEESKAEVLNSGGTTLKQWLKPYRWLVFAGESRRRWNQDASESQNRSFSQVPEIRSESSVFCFGCFLCFSHFAP